MLFSCRGFVAGFEVGQLAFHRLKTFAPLLVALIGHPGQGEQNVGAAPIRYDSNGNRRAEGCSYRSQVHVDDSLSCVATDSH